MAGQLDFDNIFDEEVEQTLNDIYNDANSVHSEESEENETEDNSENDEDTEGDELDSETTETNEDSDGDNQETEEEEENEDSENAPVEKDNEEEKTTDETTEEASDGETSKDVVIDVAEYERYKKFYDQVANVEFMANGKKVKGFTDPEKIKQAQQMAYGFAPKSAEIKKYRPFLTALRDRGVLDDPSKFNFAMDLYDGDQEALKAHMKSINVDPLDLDMEVVMYAGKNHITSREALVLEDTIEQARNYGVEEKLRTTIGKVWNQDSFNEFLEKEEVRKDLLEHMATGAFDLVQDRIAEMKTLDVNGSFNQMKSTDQYRQAVQSLTAEASRLQQQSGSKESIKEAVKPAPTPTSNKSAELVAKQEAEYKRNLETKNRLADEARKKAVSVSKKKVSTTPNTKFDPLALEGQDLDDFVMSLMRA